MAVKHRFLGRTSWRKVALNKDYKRKKCTTKKLSSFAKLTNDMDNAKAICIAQEPRAKKVANIMVLLWQEALNKYFVT